MRRTLLPQRKERSMTPSPPEHPLGGFEYPHKDYSLNLTRTILASICLHTPVLEGYETFSRSK